MPQKKIGIRLVMDSTTYVQIFIVTSRFIMPIDYFSKFESNVRLCLALPIFSFTANLIAGKDNGIANSMSRLRSHDVIVFPQECRASINLAANIIQLSFDHYQVVFFAKNSVVGNKRLERKKL